MWKNFAKGAAKGICGGMFGGETTTDDEDDIALAPGGSSVSKEEDCAENEQVEGVDDAEDESWKEGASAKVGQKAGKATASAAKTTARLGAKFTKKLLQSEEGRKVMKNVAKDTIKGIGNYRADRTGEEEEVEDLEDEEGDDIVHASKCKGGKTLTGHIAGSVASGMLKSEEGRTAIRTATKQTVNDYVREKKGIDGGDEGEEEDTMYGRIAEGVMGGLMESETGRRTIVQAAEGAGDVMHNKTVGGSGSVEEEDKQKGWGSKVGGWFGGGGSGGSGNKSASGPSASGPSSSSKAKPVLPPRPSKSKSKKSSPSSYPPDLPPLSNSMNPKPSDEENANPWEENDPYVQTTASHEEESPSMYSERPMVTDFERDSASSTYRPPSSPSSSSAKPNFEWGDEDVMSKAFATSVYASSRAKHDARFDGFDDDD